MSPPVVMQIISSMKIIMGEDGTDKGESHVMIPRTRIAHFATNYVSVEKSQATAANLALRALFPHLGEGWDG